MSDFDQVPTAVDAQAAAPVVSVPLAPVEAVAAVTATEPVLVGEQTAAPSAHESVLRRLMDRLEAVGQGLDSELSHWMQKAREIL